MENGELRIEEGLFAKIKENALFAVLLDPDSSESDAFLETGRMAFDSGADLILVGGSLMGNANLPKKIAELKKQIDIPIVLFPGGASQVVPGFDAMLFTSLVSGRNPQYLIDEQIRGGLMVKALGIEAFPTAYMLINSGPATAVEYISNTKPIPANKPKLTMAHAIAAELMGMRWTYLEAGSGAENPVPLEHIILTRKATTLNIIAGGGITTPQDAAARVKAGANVIVTGTIWEKNLDINLMKEFANAIHSTDN
ncbi:MAG: geranylgeranylglyceryl/heptaprenylglyceryl phosphate synthase [Fibromonadaceae bacterium]|jgi:putative glycerol-1-phosphate prenyltransferase/phosphoglycerol geranylgeranyltransferase|nr:geranylgeranylglyceryl/heptaprenylglyceryl phosphate synthase [Fibromonadaceae bacterium]